MISEKLRYLKASFDERKNKTTVAEYKAFVQMMPQLQKERTIVTAHSDLCKKVLEAPARADFRFGNLNIKSSKNVL